nr:Chain PA, LLSGKE Peptide [synthetic construct]7Q8O_PB Chain PB, LLSGKE Peptide [synthetic construct]
LLSGKE